MSRKKDRTENSVGGRIKAVRSLFQLTQSAFAARIHISKSSISEIEAGKKTPSIRLLKLISLVFGINEAWLTTGEGTMSCAHCITNSGCGEGARANDGDGSPHRTPRSWKISEALIMAARVLESPTGYADALYASIVHLNQALQIADKAMIEQQSLKYKTRE